MAYISENRKQEIREIVKPFIGKNLLDIAGEYGINVVEGDLDGLELTPTPSGFIIKIGEEYRIFIDKKSHTHRKRFTLAHELGHYFLHKNYLDESKLITDGDNTLYNRPGFNDLDDTQKKREIEANFFASELLMPESIVRQAYEKNWNINDLAEFFGVSTDAMYYRLKNLSIINNRDE